MYKRREKFAYVGFVVITVLFVGFIIFDRPDTGQEWMEASLILMPALFLFFLAIVSRRHYNKIKEIAIPNSDKAITDVDHLVLKKDAGLNPRVLCFEKNGHYIGMFKSAQLPWWLYPVLLYQSSLITLFPITIAFISNDNKTLLTLKRKGFKESIIAVYDQNRTFLGEYVRKEFKSLIKLHGELRNEQGEVILPVNVDGFSGDFTLKDEKQHTWAHFYNGYFPHEYTNIFKDIDNDIVELSNEIPTPHKQVLLGMVGYLFLERNNR